MMNRCQPFIPALLTIIHYWLLIIINRYESHSWASLTISNPCDCWSKHPMVNNFFTRLDQLQVLDGLPTKDDHFRDGLGRGTAVDQHAYGIATYPWYSGRYTPKIAWKLLGMSMKWSTPQQLLSLANGGRFGMHQGDTWVWTTDVYSFHCLLRARRLRPESTWAAP